MLPSKISEAVNMTNEKSVEFFIKRHTQKKERRKPDQITDMVRMPSGGHNKDLHIKPAVKCEQEITSFIIGHLFIHDFILLFLTDAQIFWSL